MNAKKLLTAILALTVVIGSTAGAASSKSADSANGGTQSQGIKDWSF